MCVGELLTPRQGVLVDPSKVPKRVALPGVHDVYHALHGRVNRGRGSDTFCLACVGDWAVALLLDGKAYSETRKRKDFGGCGGKSTARFTYVGFMVLVVVFHFPSLAEL